MTRKDYRCPACHKVEEYPEQIGVSGHHHCPSCGALMCRYFGGPGRQCVPLNLGYRESRYRTPTDATIAQYQFTHL